MKYTYDITEVLRGDKFNINISAGRFLMIDNWLKSSFGDEQRLDYIGRRGADGFVTSGYWELSVDKEEYYLAFKLMFG